MKPYIFCDFSGGGPDPLYRPLWIRTWIWIQLAQLSAVQQQAVQENQTYTGLSPPVKYFY